MMTFLPIVGRELRVAARRPLTYWGRAAFVLLAIIIGVFVYLANYQSGSRSFARGLLSTLITLATFYCLFLGVGFTADSLSEEKREGTLGLLFLTDLRGHDVILGKLAATSMSGFYAVLALFPMLAVPLLLGGVTLGEFWRVVLVLILTCLFSLAAAILVSALSRSRRKARAGAFFLLLFFAAGFPAAAGIILALIPSHRSALAEHLFRLSPVYAMGQAFDWNYRAAKGSFWWSAGVIHGLTWLFLWLAAMVVPRSWQDRPAEARGQRLREAWRNWVYGNAGQRRSFRARLLELNPVCWLASRARIKPALVWGALAVVAGFWAWGCVCAGSEWYNEGVYFPTAILLNSILKLWIASEAGRQFAEDRHSGALELVVTTPLSVKEMLRGQWLALRRQFLGPLLVVIAVELIFLAASLERESFHAQPINPVLWLAGIVMLVSDMAALGWVGMWEAMIAKRPNHVTGKTVVRILVAPWAAYVGVVILSVFLLEDSPAHVPLDWHFFVGLWFGLGLLTDAAFILAAALHLRRSFRTLALQRFAPTPSPLGRLLGRRGKTVERRA
ncbi:MAG TPA: ABC transporter permease [Dongiaceae bacterium]|nr:ABC transporter permease [Dongiaceae bacterium]